MQTHGNLKFKNLSLLYERSWFESMTFEVESVKSRFSRYYSYKGVLSFHPYSFNPLYFNPDFLTPISFNPELINPYIISPQF